MKRRITALLMSLLIVFTLTSCSSSKRYPVNISGAEISEGIYTYYYDYVLSNKDKTSKNESETSAEEVTDETSAEDEKVLIEKTLDLIKEYVAVNTLADSLGVSLSYTLKAQAASETDSRWDLFGRYYSSIGLTKQDLGKILTNKALKSALLDYYYGEDSKKKPTSSETLREAFAKKYVGINVIAASLTTTDTLGNTVPLEQYELSDIRMMFENMKIRLNSGADIDSVYSDYITTLDLIGTQSLETYLMSEESVGYGENFFSQISSLGYKTALVFEYEDTIYLAYRVDISCDEAGYFVTYKNEILEDLCLSKLEKIISAEAEKYELIKEHSSVTRKIRETVNKKHS